MGALAICSGPRLARTPSCHPGHGPAPSGLLEPPSRACVHRAPAASVPHLGDCTEASGRTTGTCPAPGHRPGGVSDHKRKERSLFLKGNPGSPEEPSLSTGVAPSPLGGTPPWGPSSAPLPLGAHLPGAQALPLSPLGGTPPWGPNPALALSGWQPQVASVQSLSHVQLFVDPVNRSTPGLPVHHHLSEFTQTHVHVFLCACV